MTSSSSSFRINIRVSYLIILNQVLETGNVCKRSRTGLKQELSIIQLSNTRCSCIAVLCFAAINLCVTSQRLFSDVSVYFFIDSVRKLLDTP